MQIKTKDSDFKALIFFGILGLLLKISVGTTEVKFKNALGSSKNHLPLEFSLCFDLPREGRFWHSEKQHYLSKLQNNSLQLL